MRHLATTIFTLILMTPVEASSELTIKADTSQRSRNFVLDLHLDCTLTDGYACAGVEEDDFLSPGSMQRMIPAVYLNAWSAAYENFRELQDLTQEQKNLRHYKVGFTENDDQYVIVLLGLAMPYVDENGRPQGLTRTVFGRSVKYWVDKESNQIVKRLFFK